MGILLSFIIVLWMCLVCSVVSRAGGGNLNGTPLKIVQILGEIWNYFWRVCKAIWKFLKAFYRKAVAEWKKNNEPFFPFAYISASDFQQLASPILGDNFKFGLPVIYQILPAVYCVQLDTVNLSDEFKNLQRREREQRLEQQTEYILTDFCKNNFPAFNVPGDYVFCSEYAPEKKYLIYLAVKQSGLNDILNYKKKREQGQDSDSDTPLSEKWEKK